MVFFSVVPPGITGRKLVVTLDSVFPVNVMAGLMSATLKLVNVW